MKWVKRLSLFIGIPLLLIILALLILPQFFLGKLDTAIKETMNEQLTATVDYKKSSLSFFRHFPNPSFSIHELEVIGTDEFEGVHLLDVERFSLSIDLGSLFGDDPIAVNAIIIDEPVIDAVIHKDGFANWDIFSDTSETDTSDFQMNLNKLVINDAVIKYTDRSLNETFSVSNVDFLGEAEIDGNLTHLTADLSGDAINYMSEGIPYLLNAEGELKLDMLMDDLTSTYTFDENKFRLNAVEAIFDGDVVLLDEGYDIDLSYHMANTEFKSLLSLIPTFYQNDFDALDAKGSLASTGYISGMYTEEAYPPFNLSFIIEDGYYNESSLPQPIQNIQVDCSVDNQTGDLNDTKVRIDAFHFELGKNPFDLTMSIDDLMTDPLIDLLLDFQFDLSDLSALMEDQEYASLSGLIQGDLDINGRLSNLQSDDYSSYSVSGAITADAVQYSDGSTDVFEIPNAKMSFNPKNAVLENLDINYGPMEIAMNGEFSNFIDYMGNQGMLKGQLNLQAADLDLDAFMGDDESSSEATDSEESEGFFVVPENVDFSVNAGVNKLNYDQISLSNLAGTVQVLDGSILLNNVRANMLGGSASLGGKYVTKNRDKPLIDMTYRMNNMDIQETFNSVSSVQALAPAAKFMNGDYKCDINFSGELLPDLSPNLESLTGLADLRIPNAKVLDLPILTKISETVKNAEIKQMDLQNVYTILRIENGKVFVDPFEVKSNGMTMTIQGSNSITSMVDYDIALDVPSSKLGAGQSLANDFLAKSPIPGVSGLPSVVRFNLKVTGSALSPNVKIMGIGAGGQNQTIQDQVKDQVKDVVNDQIDKGKDQVEDKVDDVVDETKDKVNDQIDDTKDEVDDKIDETKDEVKDKLKDKFGWPR